MSVFIVIPATLTILLLALAALLFLPQMGTLCYSNSWWTTNSTYSPHYNGNVANDQQLCKNSISEIFIAIIAAFGAIIVWAFLRVGQHTQNFG